LRQNTSFEPSTVQIGRAVRPGRVPQKIVKKSKKKARKRYISRPRGGAAVKLVGMVLHPVGDLANVIKWARFEIDGIFNFVATHGQILVFSIESPHGSYNIALRYRAGM
jgi:hypothetical protein